MSTLSRSLLLIKPVILSIFPSIAFNSAFVANLLTSGILFSTVVNAVFVAKLLTSWILPSISAILASESVFLTRPLISGILFSNSDLSVSYLVFKINPLVSILSTLATNLSYTSFLTTSFLQHQLVYLNQQEQALTYQYLIYHLQFLK